MGETELSDQEIFNRDIDWLSTSDVVIAEVSIPSLGVGFEIARAIELKKKILCLYRDREDQKLSAMISGCSDVLVMKYKNVEEIKNILDDYFRVFVTLR